MYLNSNLVKMIDTTKKAMEEYPFEYLTLQEYDIPKEYIHFACMFLHNKQLSCGLLSRILKVCAKHRDDINVYDYTTTDEFCRATSQLVIEDMIQKNSVDESTLLVL